MSGSKFLEGREKNENNIRLGKKLKKYVFVRQSRFFDKLSSDQGRGVGEK